MYDGVLRLLLLVHMGVAAAMILTALIRRRHLGLTRLLFMAILPLFGPLTCLLLVAAEGNTPPDGEWMRRNQENSQRLLAVNAQADQVVPLEEALLINEPQKRRTLMMNMLRSDPRRYLDILLVARFNEDAETAHYATATLMELQHQMQLDIQRQQRLLQTRPGDETVWAAYVRAQEEYCDSGLLEGQPLRRQRLQLSSALKKCLALKTTPEWLSLAVRNSLALDEPSLARESAQEMLRLWPGEERAWLEMMRVYAQTHDAAGMSALLKRAAGAPVQWSAAGREKLQYWMGKTHEE